MTRYFIATWLVLCLGLGPLVARERQEEAPTFPAEIEMVTVDAVVTDNKGNPIEGLTPDDFTLKEDGQRQDVVSFEAIRVPASSSAAPPTRPRVSTNYSKEVDTGRTFVVVFDDVNLTTFQAHRAKTAVAEFLEHGVREGDWVTLVATGGAAWWSARMEAGGDGLITLLKRLDGRLLPDLSPDRISPWEAMRIHVYRDELVATRVIERLEVHGIVPPDLDDGRPFDHPFITAQAAQIYRWTATQSRLTLKVLDRIVTALASTKGRKAVVLVSQGFLNDPNVGEFRQVVESSLRSNAALYFLDTRGLVGLSLASSAQFGPPLNPQDFGSMVMLEEQMAAEGAERLATDTGGFTVKNTNDLTSGIRRIAAESEVYYLLGYRPTNRRRDGRFRKIEVKVRRKGAKVRARKGYYAPLEDEEVASEVDARAGEPDFQPVLDSPFQEDAIPLRMTAYVFDEKLFGKATVLVAVDVDIRAFEFEEKGERFVDDLEFLLVVAHQESGEYFRYDQKVEMSFLPETRRKLEADWYTVAREFELEPGVYQAKMAVRDKNGDRIGSVIHDFEVPELGPLRISTPLMTDLLQDGAGGRPRPVLRVRRTFASDATLFCEFEVYGAAREEETGMPRVAAGYVVRGQDGTTLGRVEPTVIRPSSLGSLSRLFGVPLRGAPPGEYELVLSLSDQIAGESLEVREPFTIEAPSGS